MPDREVLNLKKRILSIVCISVIGLLTGCVNYDKIIEERQKKEEESQKMDEAKGIIVAELGDINNNGYTEKLILEKNVLKLTDGAEIVFRTYIDAEYLYTGLRAITTDLDNDKQNEVAVLLESTLESYGSLKTEKIYDVLVLNSNETGEYSLNEFPNEVSSKASFSGVSVDVKAVGEFEYQVEYRDIKTVVNVARLYKESLLVGADYDKLLVAWQKIMNSGYQGECLGVCNVSSIRDTDDNVLLRVQHYVVGGDGAIIGYIETDLSYDEFGSYEIKDIRFIERISLI